MALSAGDLYRFFLNFGPENMTFGLGPGDNLGLISANINFAYSVGFSITMIKH